MTSTPTTSNASKNPISLRLYKVLSTNFEDGATREALDTLSELYGSSSSSTNGITDSNPGEHAMKARRSLRRDMENKLAESSHSFVVALGEVDQVCEFGISWSGMALMSKGVETVVIAGPHRSDAHSM